MDTFKPDKNLIPDEILEKYGDDIVFDSILDGDFEFGFPISNRDYLMERLETKRKKIFYDNYFSEIEKHNKNLASGKITQDEYNKLLAEAKIKRDAYRYQT